MSSWLLLSLCFWFQLWFVLLPCLVRYLCSAACCLLSLLRSGTLLLRSCGLLLLPLWLLRTTLAVLLLLLSLVAVAVIWAQAGDLHFYLDSATATWDWYDCPSGFSHMAPNWSVAGLAVVPTFAPPAGGPQQKGNSTW